ncbi:MAG: Dam family site-specific DNA-(adenine-N6)-methyltransferase [Ignavibacteriaceae bacterium]|nr:Dam family site-specific DNA-(adenine-N6)-methyltransferase [Ignavibacteriaceae bacterium]
MQYTLENKYRTYYPPKSQLLKWVGNKQKFAVEITRSFPTDYGRYFEPFLGSGAILATVAPHDGMGSDTFRPLMEIWVMLQENSKGLITWYAERRNQIGKMSKEEVYSSVLASYNSNPNGADFLFLTRSCYGGIVRFRKADGYMSTPCGVHNPISVESFTKRVTEWKNRLKNVSFSNCDYKEAFAQAKFGDLIYCDPPYSHSQSILYGAQDFKLEELLLEIDKAKFKGIKVALSIDGSKKSGNLICNLPIPDELFEREIYINCGSSMLRRFQIEGQSLEDENVSDRLLLTY